jgi:hypothetical protein
MENAYNNLKNNGKKDISYTGKDFNSFKKNLVDYAKSYFPSTYKDFSENSTGMMFIELASYVGDVLSYYVDHQFKEGFIQYASERKNIINLANYLGYKVKTSSASLTELEVFQLIPSKVDQNGENVPDFKYCLNIQPGMEVSSSDGQGTTFRTIDSINFNQNTKDSERDISVYDRDETGQPTFYLLKKNVLASSGTLVTKTVVVGEPSEFFETTLSETNVIEILSVKDSSGNIYYEVPYLAQDTVLIEDANDVKNNPIDHSGNVPYILRYIRTSRRFTTIVNPDNTTTLEFGAGTDKFDDEIIIPNLNNVGKTKNLTSSNFEVAYDPSNFLKSNSYGSAPANTTLTIKYYVGGGAESNVNANTLNTIVSVNFADSSEYLDLNERSIFDTVKASININNPSPAIGGKGPDTDEEIRQNGMANFAAQHRTVTRDDYVIRALSMPPKFGSLAKAYVSKDGILDIESQKNIFKTNLSSNDVKITPDGMNVVYGELNNPFAINMYVLSYNNNKKLISPSDLVLNNLKNYLEKYRVLTDGLNITNAFIINFGINFEISVFHNSNKKEVLVSCINKITDMFEIENISIMQPIELGEIELELSKVSGVKSVILVDVINLNVQDGDYSENEYDIKSATIGKTIYPSKDPSIFELKFPDKDISGRVI